MPRQILSTHTQRKACILRESRQQIQVIAALQPTTSRVHKRCLLCGITAPEVSLKALSSPLLHIQGMALCTFILQWAGMPWVWEGAWRSHSESLLPDHQVGQHGPTVIVAGFPNWNHLSAQIPRVLRKQERERHVLERRNAGL